MDEGPRGARAYRIGQICDVPPHWISVVTDAEEKERKIRIYEWRVQMGLGLFTDEPAPKQR